MAAIFVNGSKRNEQFLQRTFHRCFLPRFGPFGQTVSEQKIFRNRPFRNKNCLWQPHFLMDRDEMSNLYRGPAIDTSYIPSFDSFGKAVSEEKIFQKSTNQKQELSVAAMFVNGSGQNEMSNLNRGPKTNIITKKRTAYSQYASMQCLFFIAKSVFLPQGHKFVQTTQALLSFKKYMPKCGFRGGRAGRAGRAPP